MPGYFELKAAANGQFMFNLKAANNEIILTSETYSSKAAAQNGIESVKKNATADKNFERKKATNGSPYFVLKSADNGQTIGKSEMYTSAAGMENGIKSVMTNAPAGKVKEIT
jgi:uncharacterized protein YegP (UPF0339 family)